EQNPNNSTNGRYAAYRESGDDYIYVASRSNGISPTAIDILSHEYTHAFIRRNPNLNPYFQSIEVGALNEGFADIFGLLSEKRIRGNGHNWKIGEDVSFLNRTVRNFNDPHQSIPFPQPAKYQEIGYWDFTNAAKHNNAGVLTHWLYLLSEGGTYNGVTVQGV